MDKFPKIVSYLYLHHSGTHLIYFEEISVQVLNQDSRLKILKEDSDTQRETRFRSFHFLSDCNL